MSLVVNLKADRDKYPVKNHVRLDKVKCIFLPKTERNSLTSCVVPAGKSFSTYFRKS